MLIEQERIGPNSLLRTARFRVALLKYLPHGSVGG